MGVIESVGKTVDNVLRCSKPELLPVLKQYKFDAQNPVKKENGDVVYQLKSPQKDENGNQLVYREFRNVYEYAVWLWSQNILLLEREASGPRDKVRRYKKEIATIRELIVKREAEYRRLEFNVLNMQGSLQALVDNYNENATRMTQEERDRQMEKIRKASLSMPSLPPHDNVYRVKAYDIDNMQDGKVLWQDIRTLSDMYSRRVDDLEDQKLDDLDDQIKCNKEYLKLAQEELGEFLRGERK